MLVAVDSGVRVLALGAPRNGDYRCPACNEPVIVKQGYIKVHHFAHKRGSACPFAAKESAEHLKAKNFMARLFKNLGYHVDAEVDLELPMWADKEDRRADVLVTNQAGKRLAIEVQNTQVGISNLLARTRDYARLDTAVMWLPVLKMNAVITHDENGLLVQKYTQHAMETWMLDFIFSKTMPYYDASKDAIWMATRLPHRIEKESKEWYDSDGNYNSSAGYLYTSKRWIDLSLRGPFGSSQLKPVLKFRRASTFRNLPFPSATYATLVPLLS
ncbi:hypothetical protein TSH58p_17560 [Azospirillum sp. TSH58]|uniref:competence protein CoiA n=1 Tax=Azospirillum sp. TSH58 TaxID=664962 RepID=UPI000D600167|nr:competence protein CoiA family protein [Azospirillum sp. TSH58]AWJ85171.1 hypothetical protein TSH58p_17560 [Azospirillum sp. TSH58]